MFGFDYGIAADMIPSLPVGPKAGTGDKEELDGLVVCARGLGAVSRVSRAFIRVFCCKESLVLLLGAYESLAMIKRDIVMEGQYGIFLSDAKALMQFG